MSVMENSGVRLEGPRRRLSRLTVTVFGLLFAAGIAEGAEAYARRTPGIERHAAGTNAITVHVVLAAAAAAAVVATRARRSRQPSLRRGPSPWAAPFSASAVSRLLRTLRFADGPSLPDLARFVTALPLVLVLLYTPFQMGTHITSDLNPNATVNAWGGPTYIGAVLAHWLDGIIGFYAATFLLSRLLLPASAARQSVNHENR